MKIESTITIKQCGVSDFYDVTINLKGKYIDVSCNMVELEPYYNTCYMLNTNESILLIESMQKEAILKAKKELLLLSFNENIKKYGYPLELAIKEIMESGFKIGFHYDLFSSAIIEKFNKKSITINDACNRKHYIDPKYLHALSLNQFFVSEI